MKTDTQRRVTEEELAELASNSRETDGERFERRLAEVNRVYEIWTALQELDEKAYPLRRELASIYARAKAESSAEVIAAVNEIKPDPEAE